MSPDPLPDQAATLRLAGFAAQSRVNGPGLRVVLWVQGCDLACPGCFNPGTHAPGGEEHALEPLVERILAAATPEHGGVTFSGGEPFQQAAPLAALAGRLRAAWPAATLMAFTGYRRAELVAPEQRRLLEQLDYLVDGRYLAARPGTAPWRASANQTLWVRGGAAPPESAEVAGAGQAEIQIDGAGNVLLSGFPDAGLVDWVRRLAELAR